MRNLLVWAEFHHFRVNHEHSNFIRSSCHENGQNQRVETHALARTRSTRDQKVWHLAHINRQWPTTDILAEEQRNSLLTVA